MKFNLVTTGIELLGVTVKELNINNTIVDIDKEGKRSFGLDIHEPIFQKADNRLFAQIMIDFAIEVSQPEGQACSMHLSLEGAFLSEEEADEEVFKELVTISGAAALIGIARGKIESISSNTFNNGKIVIPFVNVQGYYKRISE